MTENKNIKELIKFGDYLSQVGAELHDEVLGHDYLDEKDLQQVLGPKFIQKKLPMLRELTFHREVFGLTWKDGIKPDFTFLLTKTAKFLNHLLLNLNTVQSCLTITEENYYNNSSLDRIHF